MHTARQTLRFMHLFMLSMQLSGIMISKKVIFFNCLCLSSLYRTLSWRWSWSLWRESWQRNRSYSFLHREYPSLYKTRGAKMSWKPSGEHVYGRWLYIPPWWFFRKALESLAGREPGEPHRLREQAQREMDALREAFSKRIADLEQVSQKIVSAKWILQLLSR